MRSFAEIQNELHLVSLGGSPHGDLFVVPVGPDAPRIIVRHFNRDLPAALVPVYASLLKGADTWIEQDSELARLVRVDQPVEIGRDFIALPHRLGTPLSAYFDDEDPPEPPDELAPMQSRFQKVAAAAKTARDTLVAKVLARSILEPSGKTLYSFYEERFIIVDIKPTREDLERWIELSAE